MKTSTKSSKKYLSSLKRTNLVGRGCVLTPICSADLSLLIKWRNDAEIASAFLRRARLNPKKQKEWFRRYLEKSDDAQFIIRAAGKEKIGTVAIYNIDADNANCELGRLCIGERSHRGKGYMRAAIKTLLDYAFGKLGMYRIYLEVIRDNRKAIRLYESLGFDVEGVERGRLSRGGRRVDVLLMSVISKRRERK